MHGRRLSLAKPQQEAKITGAKRRSEMKHVQTSYMQEVNSSQSYREVGPKSPKQPLSRTDRNAIPV